MRDLQLQLKKIVRSDMTYADKLLNLRLYVNYGYNRKAANFVLYWYCESLKDGFEETIRKDPDATRYIDNLLLYYRKQLPKSDSRLNRELMLIQKKKLDNPTKQYSLFN